MNRLVICLTTLLVALAAAAPADAADPPFGGTIFIDGDIITAADPTGFASLQVKGRGNRSMYDRRVERFITRRARLFSARYGDGQRIEVRVNPEFGAAAAKTQARKYAVVVGRLPQVLRTPLATITIQKGKELFGGGNRDILIHTGMTPEYEADGILEETLVHEVTHASLDEQVVGTPDWTAAQTADQTFISDYARDFPDREDVAESFLPYLAIRYRRDRIDEQTAQAIEAAIRNRIAYFDAQAYSVEPLGS